tara:strand:+ start:836 stop:2044 length:1209 start_codon:yes stop_codon:yes gene_type:complete
MIKGEYLIYKPIFNINYLSKFIIVSYFSIFFIEIARAMIQGFQIDVIRIASIDLLTKIFFIFLIIFILTKNKINNNISYLSIIIRPYFYISVLIISSSVLIIILSAIGLIDLYNWISVPDFLDPQIHTRRNEFKQNFGFEYHGGFSFPLKISLFWIYDFAGLFQGLFGIGGRAIGLSREPHIACLFLTPSLFFVNFFIKKQYYKNLLYLLYLIFFASALAMTNIVSLFAIFLIFQLKTQIKSSNIKLKNMLIVIFLLISFTIFLNINYEIVSYILKRLNEFNIAGSSGETIVLRFKKLFIPDTLWGTGLIVPTRDIGIQYRVRDYGLLPMLFFLMHYISTFYIAIKLYFKNNEYSILGLSLIYILIHGIKVYGDLPVNFFYLFLVISIIFISKNSKINEKFS